MSVIVDDRSPDVVQLIKLLILIGTALLRTIQLTHEIERRFLVVLDWTETVWVRVSEFSLVPQFGYSPG